MKTRHAIRERLRRGPDEVVQVAGRACGGNHHLGSIPSPCGNYPASSGHQSGTGFDPAQCVTDMTFTFRDLDSANCITWSALLTRNDHFGLDLVAQAIIIYASYSRLYSNKAMQE
ncbi:hypothetical protein F2Q69_00037350 [Brassica cretica]|uniref:Uncharacterized protein n=1 Tax=Brassica cretica TaxID=69181 RepID=A0A8S9SSI3_BRACR|nr:hypothetical protein F2Q69_00037350 [Brassica cretica]